MFNKFTEPVQTLKLPENLLNILETGTWPSSPWMRMNASYSLFQTYLRQARYQVLLSHNIAASLTKWKIIRH
jgi:hypothetical protein